MTLKQLRELAEKATQGKWSWQLKPFGWKALNAEGRKDPNGNQLRVIYVRNDGLAGMNHTDADYIAAANPSTILALLERYERLRMALAHYGPDVPLE